MHEQESPPRAREHDLLAETLGEELLLYDQHSQTAHCLSPVAACLWRHCDGERDVSELAELIGVDESLVGEALYELREKDLLVAEPQLTQGVLSSVSRREAIVRIARTSVAVASMPLIVSATAATPAMASSGSPCLRSSREEDACCYCLDLETCVDGAKTRDECTEKCGSGFVEFLPTEAACR